MKLCILRINSFFDGDSVAQCTRCQELKYFRQHFTIYYNQVFWQPRPDTNYITSILETRVDSRVSTGVKFGSKRVSKFRDKHCQLPLFPENAHWADICLVEPEKGQKTVKERSKMGKCWFWVGFFSLTPWLLWLLCLVFESIKWNLTRFGGLEVAIPSRFDD